MFINKMQFIFFVRQKFSWSLCTLIVMRRSLFLNVLSVFIWLTKKVTTLYTFNPTIIHYHLQVQANSKKKCTKKPMLFLASMGKTGLSHDVFFLILIVAFWGHWGRMTSDVELVRAVTSIFWKSYPKVWLLTSKR